MRSFPSENETFLLFSGEKITNMFETEAFAKSMRQRAERKKKAGMNESRSNNNEMSSKIGECGGTPKSRRRNPDDSALLRLIDSPIVKLNIDYFPIAFRIKRMAFNSRIHHFVYFEHLKSRTSITVSCGTFEVDKRWGHSWNGPRGSGFRHRSSDRDRKTANRERTW